MKYSCVPSALLPLVGFSTVKYQLEYNLFVDTFQRGKKSSIMCLAKRQNAHEPTRLRNGHYPAECSASTTSFPQSNAAVGWRHAENANCLGVFEMWRQNKQRKREKRCGTRGKAAALISDSMPSLPPLVAWGTATLTHRQEATENYFLLSWLQCVGPSA